LYLLISSFLKHFFKVNEQRIKQNEQPLRYSELDPSGLDNYTDNHENPNHDSVTSNQTPFYRRIINDKRRQTIVDQSSTFLKIIIKQIEKQSYLFSLLSMMAWSIMYHSLLTLVFLLWACVIWMLPESRKWCLQTSPLFLVYSIALLCLEFIYGLQLTPVELPVYNEIGLVRRDDPFFHLAFKAGLALTYWLTFKQFLTERRQKESGSSSDIVNGGTSTNNQLRIDSVSYSLVSNTRQAHIVHWIYGFLVKYWIFLSSGMLLLMSCQNSVVAYRIVYMVLLIYFITTFQVNFLFYTFVKIVVYFFFIFG
jgi:hypothetical protein